MTTLLLTLALFLTASMAHAQALPTTCMIGWTASPTPDVTAYNLYIQKEGVQMPNVRIAAPGTSVSCKNAGIAANGNWAINLSAINPAGESQASNTVTFALTTSVIPLPPSQLFIK